MSVTAFTPSKKWKKRIGEIRSNIVEQLGTATYQGAVQNYFPLIRQTMTEQNCCAIGAAYHLLLQEKKPTQLLINLVSCAGYELALAS